MASTVSDETTRNSIVLSFPAVSLFLTRFLLQNQSDPSANTSLIPTAPRAGCTNLSLFQSAHWKKGSISLLKVTDRPIRIPPSIIIMSVKLVCKMAARESGDGEGDEGDWATSRVWGGHLKAEPSWWGNYLLWSPCWALMPQDKSKYKSIIRTSPTFIVKEHLSL